jgi:hypothetical protein
MSSLIARSTWNTRKNFWIIWPCCSWHRSLPAPLHPCCHPVNIYVRILSIVDVVPLLSRARSERAPTHNTARRIGRIESRLAVSSSSLSTRSRHSSEPATSVETSYDRQLSASSSSGSINSQPTSTSLQSAPTTGIRRIHTVE